MLPCTHIYCLLCQQAHMVLVTWVPACRCFKLPNDLPRASNKQQVPVGPATQSTSGFVCTVVLSDVISVAFTKLGSFSSDPHLALLIPDSVVNLDHLSELDRPEAGLE